MTMNELLVEFASAVLDEEVLLRAIKSRETADDPSNAMATIRGVSVGALLGSAFWAGALALLHALLF